MSPFVHISFIIFDINQPITVITISSVPFSSLLILNVLCFSGMIDSTLVALSNPLLHVRWNLSVRIVLFLYFFSICMISICLNLNLYKQLSHMSLKLSQGCLNLENCCNQVNISSIYKPNISNNSNIEKKNYTYLGILKDRNNYKTNSTVETQKSTFV